MTMTVTPGRLTATPDPRTERREVPFDVVAQMLDVVRFDGALFLQARFRSPWAYTSPPAADLAATLAPGADRLILFHIVARGRCWLRLEGEEGRRLRLDQGDVVVLPYGDQHVVGGEVPADPVPISTLLSPPPWAEMPCIDHGGDGERTEIVCGYLSCRDLLFDPVLQALPRAFSITPRPGPAAAWVEASMQYAVDADRHGGFSMTSQRLPELLFAEVLRQYLEDGEDPVTGWLTALADPVVGPAIAELHRDPSRDWTVTELARCVAVSRSVLDERFRQLLGRPPIRYLTDWRFQLAGSLLRSTDLAVGEIAGRVGYTAEEAFSRAFKREVGESPARWRAQARAAAGPTRRR